MPGKSGSGSIDAGPERLVIARIAARQHGVVTRQQLLATGMTRGAIERRSVDGTLHRVYRGVFKVGHGAVSAAADYTGAVLACGKDALLSDLAAAHLLRLVRGAAPPAEVSTPHHRRPAGLIVHRRPNLGHRDATRVDGIPVTRPAVTVVHIARRLEVAELSRVVHEAATLYRTNAGQIEEALARRPRAPGADRLRRVLYGDEKITASWLERRFLGLLATNNLPLPQTNIVADDRCVDCRWQHPSLTVELDSYRYHHTRHAWEQDRRREREARARGDDFRRFTYDDIIRHVGATVRELRRALRPPPA